MSAALDARLVLEKSADFVNNTSSSPMELVFLDNLSLERSKCGHKNILVITDHFVRYAQAIPLQNQMAKTTTRMLFDNFILHYGFPARIHSVKGQNFEYHLIKELCQISRVELSRTTPYRPMGNGQVERFSQTLLKMLGTLEEHQNGVLKSHIPTLAYNATFHNSSGFFPYFIMFWRHQRLAIDAFLGLIPDTLPSTKSTEYGRKLGQCLDSAYRKAQERAEKNLSCL